MIQNNKKFKILVMLKILIISDIHGNIAALDAVLKEKADVIFCLGDMVNYGPYPNECIKKISSVTGNIVRGNHDNAVGRNIDCGCSIKYKSLSEDGKSFTTSVLDSSTKDFLAHLPLTLTVEVEGIKFLLAHGSPSGDIYKYLTPAVTDDELAKEINGLHDYNKEVKVILIGHTHLPMIRKINDITIVNPGSVGQPRDGIPKAAYVVWENGSIEFKRASYNIESTVKGLQGTSIPPNHVTILAEILRQGGMY